MATQTRRQDLHAYKPLLERWMPRAVIRQAPKQLPHFDGIVTWRADHRTVTYLVEEKRHLRFQDVAVIVDQLHRRRTEAGAHATDRLLLLAPHIRPQQAEALERAGIDYLDLAGNAHLAADGLFVHVEGKPRAQEPAAAPRRPNKAWVKTVMAMLIKPELATGTYRRLAEQADVALGTVATCIADLTIRGLLTERAGVRAVRDRQALLALWVQAYGDTIRPKLEERRFQVRAADKPELVDRLRTTLAPRHIPWALTGADAAAVRTHFYRAEETEIYAAVDRFDNRDLQKALVAQPAIRGGNLLVIAPPGLLAIPAERDGLIPVAPDLLAYAELRYRGTGQALEAAELLLPRVLGDAAD